MYHTKVHVAVVVYDTIAQTVDSIPGNLGVLSFIILAKLLCILRDLDEAKKRVCEKKSVKMK